ncbi:MAG TPA: F0F1 ATP synthase subunit delta [Gammaproteobacteria bacterium]
MASLTTIARPYARAAFEYARVKKAVPQWSEQLALLAALVQHDKLRPALNNPKLTRSERAALVIKVGDKKLDEAARNLVNLLAANSRLSALPEIAAQFERLRAEQESTLEVQLVSAQTVPKAEQDAIIKALEKRFGKKVELQTGEDESLIGGAVIKAGDLVIDGSIKSRLQKLATALMR